MTLKDIILNNKEYIIENWKIKTTKEIAKDLGLEKNYDNFRIYCNNILGLHKVKQVNWTEEEFDWLKQNYKNDSKIRWNKFTKEFNEHFNSDRTIQSLKYKINQIDNYKQTVHKWAEEEKQWCIDNINNYSYKDLRKEFEKKFNCKLSSDKTIKAFLYNKFKIVKSKESRSKLHARTNISPIGTIKWTNNYGYIIKVSDIRGTKKNHHKLEHINWRPYKEYLWQQKYGEIPKGYTVIFKDGNKRNCVIDNLVILSSSSMASMACNGLWGKDEITESAIETLQAIDTINEFKSKNGL